MSFLAIASFHSPPNPIFSTDGSADLRTAAVVDIRLRLLLRSNPVAAGAAGDTAAVRCNHHHLLRTLPADSDAAAAAATSGLRTAAAGGSNPDRSPAEEEEEIPHSRSRGESEGGDGDAAAGHTGFLLLRSRKPRHRHRRCILRKKEACVAAHMDAARGGTGRMIAHHRHIHRCRYHRRCHGC